VIDKRLQKKEQTRQFRAAAKNRGFIGDDGNPRSRWLFDLFVFSARLTGCFSTPSKPVIMSEAPRRSVAYGAQSKDHGDVCWQMLFGSSSHNLQSKLKKSQSPSEPEG
jgi:hypothetical protein